LLRFTESLSFVRAGALVSGALSVLAGAFFLSSLSNVVREAALELEILLWLREMGSDMWLPCYQRWVQNL
jgi:hypothetical protein